jgi:hypothetical protein
MRIAAYALCLFFSAAAWGQAFETHGFASYTIASAPKYDIGIGASYRGEFFDVQGLLMAGTDGDYHVEGVKYLYVERSQNVGDNSAVGMRVGRVRHWLGFHNLKRENPRDSDFIWHPPAIYREHAAHMASSGDGGQAFLRTSINEWDIGLNLTHVRPVLAPMNESVAIIFGDPALGRFTNRSRITGFNVSLATPMKMVELRYDYTRLQMDFQSAIPFISSGDTDTRLHTLGARVYLTDGLDLTVERIQATNEGRAVWDSFQKVWPTHGKPGGYGVTVRWRPSDQIQLALAADRWCTDESDCAGERGKSVGIPAYAYYSNSYTVAVRYKIDNHWTSTFQVTRVEGSNTEIASSERKAVTDHIGLRVSYSW